MGARRAAHLVTGMPYSSVWAPSETVLQTNTNAVLAVALLEAISVVRKSKRIAQPEVSVVHPV
jgi:hypothetical protein